MDTVTVVISGIIFDSYHSEPISQAVIRLANDNNSYEQTSDKNGNFKFEHIAAGKYQIYARFLGYYTLQDSIKFESGEIVELKIRLGYDW